ncbi:MAG: Hdr-like menaquinol oxidoreductase cytochrome c subunit [Alphaproteobacteria bacterium]|nr:Hdr-like menaquinol oxidoreductase cytochrome c subunit [Alphaproteobacteria bacterium]
MRILVFILAMMFLPSLAAAQETGGVPSPSITKGKGEQCVADTDYMRRYHMKELSHQRDETMHEGVRTKRFSLKECIACHATTDDSGQPVPINAPGEFCASCHEYTAVKVDCFQCHATKPEQKKQAQASALFPMTALAEPEVSQ